MSGATFRSVLRPTALEPGVAALVTGPSLTGKRELVVSLCAAEAPEPPTERSTTFVTTRRDATSTARDLTEAGVPADRLSVVDCVSRSSAFDRVRDAVGRRYVADPGDLTGLGIAITEFLRAADRRGLSTRLGLHSLSTVVMYAGVRPVFRFLHVLLGRVRAAGGTAVAALDTAGLDEGEYAVLAPLFDARLEVRSRDGHDEVRARGRPLAPREWTPLREVGGF